MGPRRENTSDALAAKRLSPLPGFFQNWVSVDPTIQNVGLPSAVPPGLIETLVRIAAPGSLVGGIDDSAVKLLDNESANHVASHDGDWSGIVQFLAFSKPAWSSWL